MNSIPKTQFFEPKPTPTEKLSESLSVYVAKYKSILNQYRMV